MLSEEIKAKLNEAKSLEEVKEILQDEVGSVASNIWQEIQAHRSSKSEKLDLNELDVVSGGSDRDWIKDGCAATCEPTSWCGSNDFCIYWDVTYNNLWATCPDGHEHVFKDSTCRRCGYTWDSGSGGPSPY